MLALHSAGRLDVIALGRDHRVDSHGPEPGATVVIDGERHHFPAFVETTGQRPLAVEAFPFATLIEQGVVQDAADGAPDIAKGVAVDEQFHPLSDHPAADRIFCLSIPFILSRYPFIQGITSSHEMGVVVGAALAGRAKRSGADAELKEAT